MDKRKSKTVSMKSFKMRSRRDSLDLGRQRMWARAHLYEARTIVMITSLLLHMAIALLSTRLWNYVKDMKEVLFLEHPRLCWMVGLEKVSQAYLCNIFGLETMEQSE